MSPESNGAATGKRTYTKAIKAGKTEKEAKKMKAEAEVALAHKLGIR